MKIPFCKMSGSGNDFIIIDNRESIIDTNELSRFAASICSRKTNVGADGLILVENTTGADFKWNFFNSDGSVAEMCGNGARCVARFAAVNGIAGDTMSFETLAGIVHARVADKRVRISIPNPTEIVTDMQLESSAGTFNASSVNTGVPHVVIPVENLPAIDVVKLGREIRNLSDFSPAGTNVNFICPGPDQTISIRTYERGVEDETLACGTGSIAAALVSASSDKRPSPITLIPKSGEALTIYFKNEDGNLTDVFLEGDARIIYQGILSDEAWER